MRKCEFDFEILEKLREHFPTPSTDLAIPFDQGPRAGVLLDLIARPTLDHLGWFYSIGMMFRGLLWDGSE